MCPAERFARRSNFFVAERFTVHLGRTGAMRRTLADRRLSNDERGLLGRGLRLGNRTVHRVDIVAIDRTDHVPAVGFEAAARIVAEPAAHIAVNRDAVVVVNRDELVEAPDTRKRAHFVADAFHQATIAQEDVRAVVDDGEALAIEFLSEKLFGKRHADTVGNALAEGSGRRFDAGRHVDFGVAGRLAVQLTKVLDVLHRKVVARQVQQCVLQHRAVTVRKNEAVAADPLGIRRVEAQVTRPERRRNISHAHRHARVTGLGLLNGIHGKRANRVRHRLSGDV